MKSKRIEMLICAALLAAISLILTRFLGFYLPLFGANSVRLSLGDVPIMLSSMLFGPFFGALTGIIADVTGAMFFSGLGYFPGYTVSAMVVGIIPGLLTKKYKTTKKWTSLLAVILLTQLIASVILTTLWLTLTTGVSYLTLLPPRTAVAAVMGVVYTSLLYLIYPPLVKALHNRY